MVVYQRLDFLAKYIYNPSKVFKSIQRVKEHAKNIPLTNEDYIWLEIAPLFEGHLKLEGINRAYA